MLIGRRIERTIQHEPGIAKSDAAWDDAIQFSEVVIDPALNTVLQIESYRSAIALVTAEFMRDAVRPLETVGELLAR